MLLVVLALLWCVLLMVLLPLLLMMMMPLLVVVLLWWREVTWYAGWYRRELRRVRLDKVASLPEAAPTIRSPIPTAGPSTLL